MTWFPFLILGIVIASMLLTSRSVPKMWKGHVRTATSGKAYLWECQRARNGSPSTSRIGLNATLPYSFTLEEEKWSHAMTKMLGFCTEFQTMNDAFNQAVYIVSDDARFQQKLGADTSLHEQFLTLFRHGAKTIQATPDHLVVTLKKACEALPEEQSNAMCDALHDIKKRLSPEALGFERAEPNQLYQLALLFFRSLPAIFISMALVTAILVATYRYTLVDWTPMMIVSAQLAAIITITTLVFIRLLFCYSSYGHSMVIHTLLLSSWASALAAGSVIYFVNCAYDQSSAVVYREKVVEKRISRGKNSKRYYIRTPNWRIPSETVSMQVNSQMYNQLQIGQLVLVTARAGLLNMEWVERVDMVGHR